MTRGVRIFYRCYLLVALGLAVYSAVVLVAAEPLFTGGLVVGTFVATFCAWVLWGEQ